jgi:hypothetical protein
MRRTTLVRGLFIAAGTTLVAGIVAAGTASATNGPSPVTVTNGVTQPVPVSGTVAVATPSDFSMTGSGSGDNLAGQSTFPANDVVIDTASVRVAVPSGVPAAAELSCSSGAIFIPLHPAYTEDGEDTYVGTLTSLALPCASGHKVSLLASAHGGIGTDTELSTDVEVFGHVRH